MDERSRTAGRAVEVLLMGMRIPRRGIVGLAGFCLALAFGVLLTWRGGLAPSPSPRDADDQAEPRAASPMADRAYVSWPVDVTPPADNPATRAVRAAPRTLREADAFSSFASLSAGPASLPGGHRTLEAPVPAGLSTSLSAEERSRLLADKKGTEEGLAPGPRRDRPGVRVIIPDDDHCVPRPPPLH
jgi:hypothetical protein